MKNKEKILAVAPMMDWTDRHCRYFHRGFSSQALLFTEMITADAILHGDRDYLLGFDQAEHPVAVQLGGSEPQKLAEAAKICAGFGYDEINLNIGCPSDRVQAGTFGACLMRTPEIVGACVDTMKRSVDIPVSIKCRLGVDDQDPSMALMGLADVAVDAGANAIWVHARKAWLTGLSAKENRTVPPLEYHWAIELKARHPKTFIGINGGIATSSQIGDQLSQLDGVMIGRAAYQNPALIGNFDNLLRKGSPIALNRSEAARRMIPYARRHCDREGRLSSVTRHMLGLFHGQPGARLWRRILTEEATHPDARAELIEQALTAVEARISGAAGRRSSTDRSPGAPQTDTAALADADIAEPTT